MSDIVTPQSNVNLNNIGNSMYSLTRTNFNALISVINSSTFFEDLSLLFADPREAIINARLYPFDMTYFTSSGGAGENVTFAGGFDSGIRGFKIKDTTFSPVLLGYTSIPRVFNNFMDFEPYRKMSLYLPYYGYVDLNMVEIVGLDIYIYGVPDFTTGEFTYFISRSARPLEGVEKILLNSYTCKMSADISINFTNFNENLINFSTQIIGSAVTSGIALASKSKLGLAVVAGQAGNIITSLPDTMGQRLEKHTASSNTSFLYQPHEIHILEEHISPVEYPTKYSNIFGKPCYKTYRLYDLKGFTQVENCQLKGFENAVLEEINEIENLLKNGIIIEDFK